MVLPRMCFCCGNRRQEGAPLVLLVSLNLEAEAIKCVQRGALDYVLTTNLERLPLAVWKADEARALKRAQEQSREALAASEEKLRLLLSSTAEAIYGLNKEGRCTFSNPACDRLLGYARH